MTISDTTTDATSMALHEIADQLEASLNLSLIHI